MTEPRQSTVFDYSNLRLHPDGTRVYQKSTNLTPRIAKVAVRTSRNNWIARDAGGSSNIRKFKGAKKTLQDLQADEEFINLETGTEVPDPEDEGDGRSKIKRWDGRTAKRRKFLEDYDYLNKDMSTPGTGEEPFPYEPSSVRLSFQHLHIIFLSNYHFLPSGPSKMHPSLCFRILHRVWPVVKYLEKLSQAKERRVSREESQRTTKNIKAISRYV